MRRNVHGRLEREVSKLKPLILAGLVLAAVVLIGFVFIRSAAAPATYRQSMLVIGDTPYIVSFAPSGKEITMLSIPKNTVIRGALGVGNYSIEALVSLDSIDKHQGTLLTESVSDAFGIPVSWAVESREADTSVHRENLARIFSWRSLITPSKGMGTPVPVTRWFAFVRAVQTLPPDGLTVVDASSAIVNDTLPDGSIATTLDEAKLDYILGKAFIDAGMRSEGLTVALYNASDVPLVGSRVSRLMSRLGIQLVRVANAPEPHEDCYIWGSKSAMQSNTARFITDYFRCTETSVGDVGSEAGADIIVELGKAYAGRFK